MRAANLRNNMHRILANMMHLMGGKAAAGVLGLAYLALTARLLGVRDYGVLVLVSGYIVLVGNVIAFSGFHGIVKYGAVALRNGRLDALARLVRFSGLLEAVMGIAAIGVVAVTVPLVGSHLGWPQQTIDMALPYSLAVIATVRATPQGLLQLARRFDLIGLHQVVSPLVRLLGTIIVWLAGGGLGAVLIVWLVSAFAECIAMWLLGVYAWRLLDADTRFIGPWRGAVDENKGLMRFIAITNLDITLRELIPNLTPLTVGWLLGPAAAGLLALTQRLATILQQPAVLLSQAAYSVLAEQVAANRLSDFRHVVIRSSMIGAIFGLVIVIGLVVCGRFALLIVGGRQFGQAAELLVFVAISRALGLASAPLAAGLTALGKPGRSVFAAVSTNILLYPVLVLLLNTVGLIGAGWHAAGQALLVALMTAAYLRRDAAAAAR